ncbi:hypothetical protein niasHT_015245 [Heterodera trifolii]|uniref:RING-type domain-containing protein n=1 Tax=Heterodera trifolii TaxID=157864 RepID=A0ABD2L2F4_9BILA
MCAKFPICLLLLFLSFSLSAFAIFECDGQQNLTDAPFWGGQINNLKLLETMFMDRKLMERFLCVLSKKQRILEALFMGEKKDLLRSDAFPPPFIADDEFDCLERRLSSIHANDPALRQLLNGLFAAEMRAKRKLESLADFDGFSLLKELKQSVTFALLFSEKRHRIQLNKQREKQHFDFSKKSVKYLMEELIGFSDKAQSCDQNGENCSNCHKNGRKGRTNDDEKFFRFAFRANQIALDEAALFNGQKDERRRRKRKRMIFANLIYYLLLAMFVLIILCLSFITCHNAQNFSRNIHRNNGETEANGAMNNKRYLDTFKGIPSVVVGAKKLSEEERTECAICLCKIDAGTKVKPLPVCEHIFHNECIEMWVGGGHNGCPICRQEILDMDMLSKTTANAQANNNDNNINNSNEGTQNEQTKRGQYTNSVIKGQMIELKHCANTIQKLLDKVSLVLRHGSAIANLTICGRQLRTTIADRTIADDNCGPYFCGRQLRTVLLRTTIADRTIADDNCGPYFCGRQLRTVLLRTTIADRTFADDNCGPYFCGRQLRTVQLRTTIADRTFADDNCGPYFCGRQLRTVQLRTTIADRDYTMRAKASSALAIQATPQCFIGINCETSGAVRVREPSDLGLSSSANENEQQNLDNAMAENV